MGGSIASVTPTLGPTVGVAMTCEIDTSTPGDKGELDLYYEQLEAMQRMEEPTVWVAKVVGSRPDHECVLGDGMAKMLHAVGCAGVVTDGGVRDVEGLLTVPLAVYSRGRTIHHCALRIKRTNGPIQIGGITVSPGEIIHANVGGVIKLPRAGLEKLPALATEMRAFEHEVHRVWRETGVSLAAKRKHVADLLAKTSFAKRELAG